MWPFCLTSPWPNIDTNKVQRELESTNKVWDPDPSPTTSECTKATCSRRVTQVYRAAFAHGDFEPEGPFVKPVFLQPLVLPSLFAHLWKWLAVLVLVQSYLFILTCSLFDLPVSGVNLLLAFLWLYHVDSWHAFF